MFTYLGIEWGRLKYVSKGLISRLVIADKISIRALKVTYKVGNTWTNGGSKRLFYSLHFDYCFTL